ncbi:TonB-dependent receptor [Mucilaginibacter sp. PAMB04168]|uniref:SusC/RagA family TonB-linked outer membrane protein n=1 Tax=Mucilaginibacter sp. PAMB04168 TaxID=3138567 RepID=UPI0031F678EB
MRRFLLILLTSFLTIQSYAQNANVSGKVTDEKGEPLVGVNVKVVGGTAGATTNVNGVFTVNVPSSKAELSISYIGYVTQQIAVTSGQSINVKLSQVENKLTDVVVVAYGTQKRTSLTGSVGTVSASEIRKNSVSDLTNTITGRTPGVRVTQLSAQPGKFETSIDIRGFATYRNDGITPQPNGPVGGPLFVIDGIPRSQADFARLDPNEIESFSVLKDATAAIYGLQAANGVILVTTRKGLAGKLKVDYNFQVGIARRGKIPQLSNAAQYTELYNEKAFNDFVSGRTDPFTPLYSRQQIADYANGTLPSTDWTATVFKKQNTQEQHNLTINGGSDKVQYFTSLGYFREGGFLNSDIEQSRKYNFRQTVTAKILDGLTLDANIGFNNVVSTAPNSASGNIAALAGRTTWRIAPVLSPYSNNDPNYLARFDSNISQQQNILAALSRDLGGYSDENTRRFTSVFNLNYVIPTVKGLSARAAFAYDNNYGLAQTFNKAFNLYTYTNGVQSPTLNNAPSNLTERFDQSTKNDLQLGLNYQRSFGKHNLSALALYENIDNAANFTQTYIQYAIDAIQTTNAGILSTSQATGSKSANANISYVGRINYDYAGKYLAEFGFREQGSSYFAPGSRYGFFPYGSVGYRLSEEPFIKNNFKWIDNLKIRGSYGKLGDDVAAAQGFPSFLTGYVYPATGSTLSPGSGGSKVGSVFGTSGITKGVDFRSVVPSLTWYESKTTDIGLEASFWKGLLTFEADVFRRDRTGLLAGQIASIPSVFGAALPKVNLNSDRTQGFEIILGHHNKIGQLVYNISANMGYSRSQWLHFEETAASDPYNNYRTKFSNRYFDQIFGYKVIGQFQNYQEIYAAPIQDGAGNRTLLPGDYNYEDTNGDGIIDQRDQTVLATGGNRPLTYFGVTFDFQYKNFDLTALIQGATNYSITYQDQLSRPFFQPDANPVALYYDRWHRADLFDVNSAWIPGRFPSTGVRQNYKDAGFVNIGNGGNGNAAESNFLQYGNSRSIFDGTYARLKQLQIGYTLPAKALSKLHIARFRVFATGYNLFTVNSKALDFVDPEFTNSRLYGYNYPLVRNYNIGAQVTF